MRKRPGQWTSGAELLRRRACARPIRNAFDSPNIARSSRGQTTALLSPTGRRKLPEIWRQRTAGNIPTGSRLSTLPVSVRWPRGLAWLPRVGSVPVTLFTSGSYFLNLDDADILDSALAQRIFIFLISARPKPSGVFGIDREPKSIDGNRIRALIIVQFTVREGSVCCRQGAYRFRADILTNSRHFNGISLSDVIAFG